MLKGTVSNNRLEQLRALREVLADEIDQRPGARDLAQLSRQYRETLKEIETIEEANGTNDEISQIIAEVEVDKQPRIIRKTHADVLRDQQC